MAGSLDALLGDPWQFLDRAVDGPLHPGGIDATAALLDRADVGPDTRLLDVGCGAGEALALARDRGAEAVGLDRKPTGTVRGDLTALPFRARSFDVVLGECVLCLSPDLGATLDDVARTLRPGGRLALSDVTVEGEPPDLPAPLDRMFCLDGPRSRDHVRGQVRAAGLAVESTRDHREDLLAMRDRLLDVVDLDRLSALLGDRGDRLRAGVERLDAAAESGRIGYVSLVAVCPRS